MKVFSSICRECEKFGICSEARKFIVTHGLKLESQINFQFIGLREMYGDSVVDRAIELLQRFRRSLGYRYSFTCGNTNIYLRKNDIKTREDLFTFNPVTNFYELDLGQGNKALAAV